MILLIYINIWCLYVHTFLCRRGGNAPPAMRARNSRARARARARTRAVPIRRFEARRAPAADDRIAADSAACLKLYRH